MTKSASKVPSTPKRTVRIRAQRSDDCSEELDIEPFRKSSNAEVASELIAAETSAMVAPKIPAISKPGNGLGRWFTTKCGSSRSLEIPGTACTREGWTKCGTHWNCANAGVCSGNDFAKRYK